MKLDDAVQTVYDSQDDWVAFEFPVDDMENHGWVATYRDDVLLQLRWGLRESDGTFDEPWSTGKFPAPGAYSFMVDMTYGGSMLRRTHAVSVDGGRYYLPMPKVHRINEGEYEYHMTKEMEALGRLLHDLAHAGGYSFADGVATAGLKRV